MGASPDLHAFACSGPSASSATTWRRPPRGCSSTSARRISSSTSASGCSTAGTASSSSLLRRSHGRRAARRGDGRRDVPRDRGSDLRCDGGRHEPSAPACARIHRPPRRPADRLPHCHWRVTIEPRRRAGPRDRADRRDPEVAPRSTPAPVGEARRAGWVARLRGSIRPRLPARGLLSRCAPEGCGGSSACRAISSCARS